jgi:aspartate/methionine/tyrosine aminotransferase
MVEISTRTLNLGTENAFVVLKEVNELLAKGRSIVNFCIGQPDFDTPEYIKRAAIKALENGKTGYTASAGIPELREAAAKYLSETRSIDVNPESVVVANGAKPFIGYTILSTTDHGKGDEVLYPNPGFPIYESLIKEYGAVPVPLPLLESEGYAFDIDHMAGMINEKTRLLIINSPHNPTGGVLKRETLEEISEVVKGYDNLWIFSDEPYSRMAAEDLRDDRVEDRLRLQHDSGPSPLPVDHQHRLLRWPPQPVCRRRSVIRATGGVCGDDEELQQAA